MRRITLSQARLERDISRKVGRWMFNTEGRFFGGMNYQNIHQFGVIGSNLTPPGGLFQPLTLGPVAFSHAEFMREFTPGIELRLELRYQMTRSISLPCRLVGNLDG